MEIVGAWLATATAMPPVVTKSYEVDLPRDRACHKRIAYANPWSSTRLFRLASSDPKILRPRYESLEVGCVASTCWRKQRAPWNMTAEHSGIIA